MQRMIAISSVAVVLKELLRLTRTNACGYSYQKFIFFQCSPLQECIKVIDCVTKMYKGLFANAKSMRSVVVVTDHCTLVICTTSKEFFVFTRSGRFDC